MDPGRVAVAAAPGGLAVDGDVGGVARPEPPPDPPADPGLEVGDVDPAEDPRVGGLAEAPPGGEPEELEELPAPLLAVLDDRLVAGHAREHGDDGQAEQGRERVPLALGPARIMKALKEFHQGDVGLPCRSPDPKTLRCHRPHRMDINRNATFWLDQKETALLEEWSSQHSTRRKNGHRPSASRGATGARHVEGEREPVLSSGIEVQ